MGSALALLEPDVETALALATTCALCGLSYWLLRRGLKTAAVRLLFLSGTAGATVLVMTGRTVGLGDTAMMLYPVLVIAASLLLGRRDAALGLGLVLLVLGAVLAATLTGLLPSDLPPPEHLADFGFATLIVAISGLAASLMATGLERSRRASLASAAALSRANLRLEERARERAALAGELEARNDELQHFTYTVSHDLKSPLVTIGGFLGCLQRDLRADEPDRMLEDLRRIKQGQEAMSEVLASLLELSRAGRLAPPEDAVSLSEVVEEARALTEGLLAEHGVRLVVGRLPTVVGDRRRLIQVFQNLLENAAKFSGDAAEPTVEIGAREANGETVLHVRDPGIGIEPADQERVFELFHKLDRGSAGTGVGLALVRRIIQVHGGRVWVESEGAGRGTKICFTLQGLATPPAARREPTDV